MQSGVKVAIYAIRVSGRRICERCRAPSIRPWIALQENMFWTALEMGSAAARVAGVEKRSCAGRECKIGGVGQEHIARIDLLEVYHILRKYYLYATATTATL
jgi:hypothetical protein